MIEKIMSDLYLIKVPIPNNPLKATNSYIIKGKGNNLIIDTGFNFKKSSNTILSGLKKIDVDLKKTDFFITHLHSDHLDLALALAKNSSKIYFNRPDAETIGHSNKWDSEVYNIARVCGFPENRLQEIIKKYSWHRYRSVDPAIFTILKETGVEGRELATTTRNDIDAEQGIINVQGCKGHNSRSLKLKPKTADMLKAYLDIHKGEKPFPQSKRTGEMWRK